MLGNFLTTLEKRFYLSHCYSTAGDRLQNYLHLSVRDPTAAVFIRFWWNFAQCFGARKVRSNLFGVNIQWRSDGGEVGGCGPHRAALARGGKGAKTPKIKKNSREHSDRKFTTAL